ncbi:MAG: alpha/beta fold hydrolase, partial [Thermoleophilaceae bacterium]|nr:alpha/beta fold hydrolase [Thermoleophilaceae bacterium]
MAPTTPPRALKKLVSRYDPVVAGLNGDRLRVRLAVEDGDDWDAVLEDGSARLSKPDGRPSATLSADRETWELIAGDVRGGMEAFEAGRLSVRANLHLGVAFLAGTSGAGEEGGLHFEEVDTRLGAISTLQAGEGPAVLAIHGLGGTKASFLPTVADLAPAGFRVIALDLPGFGDSVKPLGADYDARFFARAVEDVIGALGLDHPHLIGNSLGGRVALEVGLRSPQRIGKLVLLAPSMAWRRKRPWAPLLRLVPPELGAIQPAPRAVVERIVGGVVPGAKDGWTASGVDEFMRAYLTPRGRAAFYAAARQIYLEEPHGENGFWPRLEGLRPESLWVWGKHDQLVPLAFARHVTDALPGAGHLELACGHVPQVER